MVPQMGQRIALLLKSSGTSLWKGTMAILFKTAFSVSDETLSWSFWDAQPAMKIIRQMKSAAVNKRFFLIMGYLQ